MQNLLLGNWRTTLIGFLAALVNYFVQSGNTFPATKQEWLAAIESALLIALGIVAKDGSVGSKAIK